MQQMADRPKSIGEREGSRRRPPRRRSPSPIPEPAPPARPPRAVPLQDILKAHLRAVDARIEAGLHEFRRASAETLSAMAAESARSTTQRGPGAAADTPRGVLAHAEERFQAITVRLQRMEGALRQLARAQRDSAASPDLRPTEGLVQRVEMLARVVADMSERQQQAIDRLAAAQIEELSRLRHEQRTLLQEVVRRTGLGVVAVARRLKDEIGEEIRGAFEEDLQRSGPPA